MIYSNDEWINLFKKNKNLALKNTDSYFVKYKMQKEDGFWTSQIQSGTFHGPNKGCHQEVEDLFRKQMKGKNFEIISVNYV